MSKNRFGYFLTSAALVLAAASLQAQTSIQRITFQLLAQYQKDTFYTNLDNPSAPLTNTFSGFRQILIGTGNVVKALAVDLDGTNTGTNTNWRGSDLVREVNLIDGTEGIFLRKNGSQTNVSSFFGGSFSNNFQGELALGFPMASNNFTNVTYSGANVDTNTEAYVFTNTVTNTDTETFTNVFTNYVTNIIDYGTMFVVTNNFVLQNPLDRGWTRMPNPTNFTTNYDRTAGLYFVSFSTTNLKFNLVSTGDGSVSNVSGTIGGTNYSRPINSEALGSAGDFYLNTATNIFDMGTNPAVWVSGPLRGSFAVHAPYFSRTNGP